jgi:GxxExxY protein
MNEEDAAREIVDAAIAVHRELGPGLLESAYEQCLAFELVRRGLKVERQKVLPVIYQELQIDAGYRIDLLVQDRVVVELKAVEKLESIHEAQVLTYLKHPGAESVCCSTSMSGCSRTAFAALCCSPTSCPLCPSW